MAALLFASLGLWQSRSIATPESDQATALFGTFTIDFTGYLGILATMIVIALLTTLTARFTVMRTIDEIDLIRSDRHVPMACRVLEIASGPRAFFVLKT